MTKNVAERAGQEYSLETLSVSGIGENWPYVCVSFEVLGVRGFVPYP